MKKRGILIVVTLLLFVSGVYALSVSINENNLVIDGNYRDLVKRLKMMKKKNF